MKESGKMAVYIGMFIIVMVGYIVLLLMTDFIIDLVSGIVFFPKDWGFGKFAIIDYLTPPRLTWLVYAIGWFLMCIIVNIFLINNGVSTRWFEEGEKVEIKSLFFLFLWFITTLAIVIGFIIKTILVSTISWEILLDELFVALFWALAPTLTALHGVSNKSRIRG
ncbi:MAG: hypothetical protein ACXADY_19895 [Candidatus Hodarchaeales archaeon]|jgi:hypothetical protein